MPRVLVSLVTHNSDQFLAGCLQSLRDQSYQDLAICLWDNASQDNTMEIISQHGDLFHSTHFSPRNLGFSAAHNKLIASIPSDYALVLNPDVVMEPLFIENLVRTMDQDEHAGSATGKLWRWTETASSVSKAPASDSVESGQKGETMETAENTETLDTTGIFMVPNQRHLDRGSGERDVGQYDSFAYVFGASGAAAFYRRTMLEEVKIGTEYFDEAFFAYREDADLAWRAQWLGWRCLYVPDARAFHVRHVLPERRAQLADDINMHSFKNRFLLRLKNMDLGTYCRFFIPITSRDAIALGYVLLFEWSSLRAFPLIARHLPRCWAIRRAVRRHRKISPREMRSWFSYQPIAKPTEPSNN